MKNETCDFVMYGPGVEKIYDEYIKLLDFNDGITEVTVTTTKALNKKQEEMIKSKIGKHLNSKIKLKKIIDSEIIVVVQFLQMIR